MNTTPEALIKEYADPIEQQEIDKFVCAEMGRQIHRYIKGMSGTKLPCSSLRNAWQV